MADGNVTPLSGHARPRSPGGSHAPWSILLAGGGGSRLSHMIPWFHRDDRPKQFATLIGTRSLLRHTCDRALALSPPHRMLVILTAGQERWARHQLPPAVSTNLVVQPRNIGTGPAVCLAIARVAAEDPGALVAVYPSDHFIYPEERFHDRLAGLLGWCRATENFKVTLLGAEPSDAREGMGWIVPGKSLAVRGELGLIRVDRFEEKPGARRAEELFEEGALWNTFIMVGMARAFCRLVSRHMPGAGKRMDRFQERWRRSQDPCAAHGVFEDLEPFDFSRRVLQRAGEDLLLYPLQGVQWRDWGTPQGFFETLETMDWLDRLDASIPAAALKSL